MRKNDTLNLDFKFFLEKNESETLEKMDLEYFSNFSKTLHKIKEVRNMIAHSLKTINRDDFNIEAKVGIDTVNSKIINFFKKYYRLTVSSPTKNQYRYFWLK